MTDHAFRAPKGTRDIMWPDSARWRALVEVFADVAGSAGYLEVVPPMFEHVEVFQRLGEDTDVVRKEMYAFEDKGGRTMALRPEQTASVVRAFAEHRPSVPYKAWYSGPNFRYERAQRGRFRQFDQVGVEVLGPHDPHLDAEVITLAWRFYERLGLRQVKLLVNSLGSAEDRARYVDALRGHFEANLDALSEESRTTLATNPLRVLDSKREVDAEAVAAAPQMLDHLSDDAAVHFASVTAALDSVAVPYTVAPRLVRGLDYYVRTTFEFAAEALDAAQNAVGGGGRYDGLAAELGAPETPGVGFALGVDRTLLACDAERVFPPPTTAVDVFVVDTTGGDEAVVLADLIREAGLRADRAWDGRSMKAQMKAADRSAAAVAVIVGEDEKSSGTVTVRDLRGDGGQETVERDQLIEILRMRLR
ncbi:MAG: histidine--tRNA ligase [Actinomycetota bacterium]|nr:histidine--tRNA ligase [Actinomycetota bacterium]MED6327660.1 histidine--tRNA ligase [Actinomycetota bacterium]